MKGIGHKIRAARFTRGKEWTQKKLADAAGLSQGYISAIERGDEFPSLKALKRIGEVLDCSLSYFIDESDDLESPITDARSARRPDRDDMYESVKSNLATIFEELVKEKMEATESNGISLQKMFSEVEALKKKVAGLETGLKKSPRK